MNLELFGMMKELDANIPTATKNKEPPPSSVSGGM
jgi:hypothetical protein